MRTGCRNQAHVISAKPRITKTCSDTFGPGECEWLQELALPQPYRGKRNSLLNVTDALTGEIVLLEEGIADLLADHRGSTAIQVLPGNPPASGRSHRRRDR